MAHHDSIDNLPSTLDPGVNSFWQAPTLEQLIAAQGVKPISDIRVLYGTWPGEEEDGFEAMIDALRHPRPQDGGHSGG